MVSLEKYNLRWNAFEANIRKTLKELRGEAEFLDVTVVAGDGQQVRANKLVLAGGSSFFHKILKENPHPHPLIYLKGVSYEHLISLLDFVYTGETNIAQKDLDQFLDTAKELHVKGLVENQTSGEIFDEKTKSRPTMAFSQDQVTTKRTCPSSRVAHSQKVITPHISKSTCQESHNDSSVADHSNIPSGMEGQDEAEGYDDDQVKSINSKNNIVLSDEYQNEKKQAILAGKNLNDIYDTELYKEEGDMEDTEATVCGVKNDWYGYGEENDDANVEQNWNNKAFPPGKKCYQCSFCNKTFARTDKLNRHIMVHTGEKPFQCLVCYKTFSRQDHLAVHNRIHTDEKPFQCLVCTKMFSRHDHFKQHMKTKKCSMKT